MKSILVAALAFLALAAPARAVTIANGVVLITQADALAGGVTPGDTAGFPVTLSATGSYRLASNLLVSTAVNGIEVTAPEVSIDFFGFRLAGSGVAYTGISGTQRALTVKGGTIRGFTNKGVLTSGKYLRVENMIIVENSQDAIMETGSGTGYARIVGNTLVANFRGVNCGSFCTVVSNTISDHGGIGVLFNGPGGHALGNNITNNASFAIFSANVPYSVGNNTLIGNGTSVSHQANGPFIPMQPNACSPTAC